MLKIANKSNANCPVYNCGSDNSVSLNRLSQLLSIKYDLKFISKEIKRTYLDQYVPNINKFRTCFIIPKEYFLASQLDGVPDKAITIAGRAVQCGSCGNKWKQFPIKNETNKVISNKKINQTVSGNTGAVYISPLNSLRFVLNKLKKDKIIKSDSLKQYYVSNLTPLKITPIIQQHFAMKSVFITKIINLLILNNLN